MGQFMLRRTMYAVITLLILSLTIFTVVRLTGDPVTLMAEPGAQEADLARLRAEWGLDLPWPVQYATFVKNVVIGKLGQSFNYEMPVSTLYFQRLPNSLELAGVADRPRAVEALTRLGRSPSTRAEALAPPEFVELERLLA